MNRAKVIAADLCVIGAGSAGLSAVAGAAQLGVRTVLIERDKMGGDCLNYGCVPSKALLAAGDAAWATNIAPKFGVTLESARVDGQGVHDHLRRVIATIAPIDSIERFERLGATVIIGDARFTGEREVAVNGTLVQAKRLVVATGSRAAVPPIPGLLEAPYLTNETLFDLTELPAHLMIIGGGPIGCEMAQAYRRLGAPVTVIDAGTILPKDDPELVAILRQRLLAEGIAIHEHIAVERVAGGGGAIAVTIAECGQHRTIGGSHLLVAAGRTPTIAGLDLETAGIAFTARGITVDDRLRTTNKHVYAIGDVIGGYQFTHAASYHAGIVIRNALFKLPAKVDYRAMPWCTYTDPELASAGMSEGEARQRYGDSVQVLTGSFSENDRAVAEHRTDGLVKAIVRRNGAILGASIVGPAAGELIQAWCLAIGGKLRISAIAQMIAPYPTLGEINKRVASSFFTPKLFSQRTRALVRLLSRFG